MDHAALAKTLFTALQKNDANAVRALCHPKLLAYQNLAPAMDLETLLDFTNKVTQKVPNFRYENPIIHSTEAGFVEEHLVRGTLNDSEELELAVCVVAEVINGKVTVMREYVDSSAAQGLIAALSS